MNRAEIARLRAEALTVRFEARSGSVTALDGVDLAVGPGEVLAVRGPSGSGKTTLLLALGGMRAPSAGKVLVEGEDLYAMSRVARAAVRAGSIGFVFQSMHLIPYLDLESNVSLALRNVPPADARRRAHGVLGTLGLGHRARHHPGECSAGERQRAALARATIGQPGVLLADEPTGNLDAESAELVWQSLSEFAQRGGAVVVATHDAALAERGTYSLALEAGRGAQD